MTEEQFNFVRQRLDAILVMLMLNLPDDKAGKELVVALDNGGMSAKDIAQLLGQKVGTIRKTLERARKG